MDMLKKYDVRADMNEYHIWVNWDFEIITRIYCRFYLNNLYINKPLYIMCSDIFICFILFLITILTYNVNDFF